MRNKLTSRVLAALLAVVMVVGLLPMTALAARVITDDAPMAETAMGEEAVTAPVRATSKAAEVAEAEETVMVAKAELGTSATFGGDQVALSNALYTFAANGTGYTISATVPGTETTVYLNIAGGTSTLPNMTSANGTPVGLTEQTDSNSNKWLELRDGSSLHFHRGANELYFNRCTTVSASDMPNHYFALFRAATEDDTSSGDIPGYVRLTALNEVTSGGAYLIAAKVSDNWYVLYPTTGSDKYNHVAKVVLVEEVVETPDEPETPVEKTRYYFTSSGEAGSPWTVSATAGVTNTVSHADGSGNVTEINDRGDYRIWSAGPGFLNFDLVDGVLLAKRMQGGTNAASLHVEHQSNGAYIISHAYSNGTTYYMTAENQNGRAVFSPNEADAVPYVIEATAAGAVTYGIWCEGPYTVNFNGGYEGAEAIESLEGVYYGTTLPTPADREGYTFLGWFDNSGNEYTGVTADVALTAKWKMDPGYTPAEAVAEGKTVTYLAFTGGTNSSRWWDAAEEAGATTHIQLYNAAGTATDSAITLDTDGITAGNYVINFDTGNSSRQALMHYSNGVSNQCGSSTTTVSEVLHLFVFEKAEDNTAINAFTIKAYNTTKYLSLEASGNNRLFKDDKTTFYVTPVNETNDGTYYIWTATDPEPVPDVPGVEPPAELEPVYEYRLDTDGLESGEYGITAPGNNRTVGMHDSGSYTNQCPVTITGEVMTLPHIEHNWTVVQKPNGKYTIQGSGGKYLTSADCTNPSNQLVLGTEAEEFTVTHVSGGSYTVQNAAGKYLTFTESGNKRWGMADSAFNLHFFKKTEVEPTMAQTKFSGTSDKPMDRLHILNQDDDVDTEYRIPALVTLDNGWIVAACDIRWSNTEDSPNNLDTIVSISKDGGESWEWEVVNYFSDFAPLNGGRRMNSASFIDPALLVDNDGTLWMAVDLQPAHVNLGQNAQKTGSGFDENGLLMVGPISEAEWATKVDTALGRTEATRLEYQAQYAYRVDINGVNSDSVTATATKDGEEVTVYSIFHATEGWHTGYYVDAFCDLYYDYDEAGIQPVLVAQKESTSITQANLFYIQSPWKAYSTTYLMIRKATVEGEGLAWGDPQLVSGVKNFDGETFLAFCPGRGTSIQVAGENGETVERIIFPVYDNVSSERASAVYTDDGGATWHRGARVENGETSSNSESQIVELHDEEGNSFLRMFSRNNGVSGKYVSYADSFDNGLTWTTTKFDRDMPNGESTMMSFIGLEGFLVSPEGAVYEDLVLASYPRGTGSGRRSNGIVRIGYYDAEAEAMVWLNDKEAVRYPYKFTYSCLTQLRDEDGFTDGFALLYEDERNWAANYGMEMGFDTFTSADLLGEGWVLVQEKPGLLPNIESEIVRGEDEEVAPVIAAANVLDMNVNTTGALRASVTFTGSGADDETGDIVVTWTSSDPSVATVSKVTAQQAGLLSEEEVVTTTGEEQVSINAVGVGRAFITASTTKNGIIREAVTEVVVQGEDDITLPECYTNAEMAENTAGTATTYTINADGLNALIEAGGKSAEDYTETLALAKDYANRAEAKAAQAQIVEATKTLYAELTGRDYETPAPSVDVYTVDAIADRIHTGEAIEPTVVVRKNGAILSAGYTLEYSNNVNVGTATVNVMVGGAIVATGTFQIVEDSAGGDTGNTGSNTGSGSSGGGSYTAPVEEDLEDEDVPLAQLPMTFVDVKMSDWFCAAAEFVFAKNLMQGVSATEFRPTMNTTRGMVVTILHRMEEEPEADPATFMDVASTAWYGPAVAWGVQSNVVKGASDGGFHPMEDVTREQLAVFLYRFAEHRGYDVTARGELGGYADSETVSGWAADAMSWAVGTGLITGKSGNVLDPLSTATRAELATILTRFCKQFVEEK